MTLWKIKKLESIPGWKWKKEGHKFFLRRDYAEWVIGTCEWYLKDADTRGQWVETEYAGVPVCKWECEWEKNRIEDIPGWKWMTLEECSEARKKIQVMHGNKCLTSPHKSFYNGSTPLSTFPPVIDGEYASIPTLHIPSSLPVLAEIPA